MSRHYGDIAFTDAVSEVQDRHGSRTFYDRHRARATAPDVLGEDERAYLADRDEFSLATVGETGWPYVQFRGGPAGFLHVLDEHTLAWADFRGNLQYVSVGNVAGDDRVALLVLDHATRRRLKVFGRARVVTAEEDPELVARLAHPGYDAVVQRAVVVTVEAFDWNCPQHITPRFSAAEIAPRVDALNAEIARLRTENAALTARLAG